jgi:hypothetical protein
VREKSCFYLSKGEEEELRELEKNGLVLHERRRRKRLVIPGRREKKKNCSWLREGEKEELLHVKKQEEKG